MASVVRFVISMVGEVCRVMEKDEELQERLYGGLQFIMQEMEMVSAWMKDQAGPRGAVQEARIRQLQELACDVEDFVEGLWVPGAYGKALVVIGRDPRARQLISIEQLEKRVTSLTKEWNQSAGSSSSQGEAHTDHDAMSDAEEELEGMGEPKRKILELLSPSPAEGAQLRVVSIVGCCGVGKTALARAVYMEFVAAIDEGSSVSYKFDCVAWVTASGCNDQKALLDKILTSVRAALASRPNAENVPMEAEGAFTINPQDILRDKRYLVFVDDVQQAQVWKDTVHACPDNGRNNRIIVTTSLHSVAAACSSGSYVYSVQCLCDDDSKGLFWRKIFGSRRKPPHALKTDSEGIFSKCGGLPLALTCVAKHLNIKGIHLAGCHCKQVGQNLGREYLSDNTAVSAFKGVKRALMQCYDSLPDYDHRSFLLYLSVYPRGHQIKSKSLARRLKAEGLVVNEGSKCFDELIDRCIIDPVQTCDNSVAVKRGQVHAVVLEYIIQKSEAKNVVTTLIQGQEPRSPEASVRRLSIQSGSMESFDDLPNKSALRSLTMFNGGVSDLQRYKFLRLLDLYGCTGLEKAFIEGLCELVLLRYLSLRKTDINKLPTKIERLQCLETLDLRETKVEKLPIEVIMLPKLAYLFGKFQLPDVDIENEKELSDFLKKKSLLHTISGFIANKTQGREYVILRLARNLKKVKVWCNNDSRMSFPAPIVASSSSRRKRKRIICTSPGCFRGS